MFYSHYKDKPVSHEVVLSQFSGANLGASGFSLASAVSENLHVRFLSISSQNVDTHMFSEFPTTLLLM